MLNTCSSSSPGLSGCISPFAKTEKLWFDAKRESENKEYEVYKDSIEHFKEKKDGRLRVDLDVSSPDDYFRSVMNVQQSIDGFEVSFPNQVEEEEEKPEDELIEL